MMRIATGEWGGAAQSGWPLGREVAIHMRPETAVRHLEAGMRLGRHMTALGSAIRRVLEGRVASRRIAEPADRCCSGASEPLKSREDKAA